jgi:hypothetical protein
VAGPVHSSGEFEQNNYSPQNVTGSGDIHVHRAELPVFPGRLRWREKHYPVGQQIPPSSGALLVLIVGSFFFSIVGLSWIFKTLDVRASVSIVLSAGSILLFIFLALTLFMPVFRALRQGFWPMRILGRRCGMLRERTGAIAFVELDDCDVFCLICNAELNLKGDQHWVMLECERNPASHRWVFDHTSVLE